MKHTLITAAALLAAGIVAIFMAGIMLGPAEAPRKRNQTVQELKGEFTDIVIEVAGSEVEVTYTSGDTCHLNYGKDQPIDYTMTVENGTLYVTEHDDRAWYEYLYLEDCWMTLYLPEGDYRSVTIRSTSGDVFVDELQTEQLEIKTSSGRVSLADLNTEHLKIETSSGHMKTADTVVTEKMELSTSSGDIGIYRCEFDTFEKESASGDMEVLDSTGKHFSARSSSGDTMLKNVLLEEKLEMDTSSGDISFRRCDFGEMELETSSGDVEGTILSKKFFVVTTDSGDCSVPAPDESCGRCKITTESGDIEIKIVP